VAFNNAKTDADKAQVISNVIATLVENKTITPEKADELRVAQPGGGKRRRTSRKTRKGRKGGKRRRLRNSTFRRHRKH
jgi:hypothetical protein